MSASVASVARPHSLTRPTGATRRRRRDRPQPDQQQQTRRGHESRGRRRQRGQRGLEKRLSAVVVRYPDRRGTCVRKGKREGGRDASVATNSMFSVFCFPKRGEQRWGGPFIGEKYYRKILASVCLSLLPEFHHFAQLLANMQLAFFLEIRQQCQSLSQ